MKHSQENSNIKLKIKYSWWYLCIWRKHFWCFLVWHNSISPGFLLLLFCSFFTITILWHTDFILRATLLQIQFSAPSQCIFFSSALLWGLQNLSSLIMHWTCTPCIASSESQPLDHEVTTIIWMHFCLENKCGYINHGYYAWTGQEQAKPQKISLKIIPSKCYFFFFCNHTVGENEFKTKTTDCCSWILMLLAKVFSQ